MMIWRMPPGFMPITPCANPGTTWSVLNCTGWPLLGAFGLSDTRLLSKTVPSVSQPVYWAVNVSPFCSAVPTPVVTSLICTPPWVVKPVVRLGMVLDIPESSLVGGVTGGVPLSGVGGAGGLGAGGGGKRVVCGTPNPMAYRAA